MTTIGMEPAYALRPEAAKEGAAVSTIQKELNHRRVSDGGTLTRRQFLRGASVAALLAAGSGFVGYTLWRGHTILEETDRRRLEQRVAPGQFVPVSESVKEKVAQLLKGAEKQKGPYRVLPQGTLIHVGEEETFDALSDLYPPDLLTAASLLYNFLEELSLIHPSQPNVNHASLTTSFLPDQLSELERTIGRLREEASHPGERREERLFALLGDDLYISKDAEKWRSVLGKLGEKDLLFRLTFPYFYDGMMNSLKAQLSREAPEKQTGRELLSRYAKGLEEVERAIPIFRAYLGEPSPFPPILFVGFRGRIRIERSGGGFSDVQEAWETLFGNEADRRIAEKVLDDLLINSRFESPAGEDDRPRMRLALDRLKTLDEVNLNAPNYEEVYPPKPLPQELREKKQPEPKRSLDKALIAGNRMGRPELRASDGGNLEKLNALVKKHLPVQPDRFRELVRRDPRYQYLLDSVETGDLSEPQKWMIDRRDYSEYARATYDDLLRHLSEIVRFARTLLERPDYQGKKLVFIGRGSDPIFYAARAWTHFSPAYRNRQNDLYLIDWSLDNFRRVLEETPRYLADTLQLNPEREAGIVLIDEIAVGGMGDYTRLLAEALVEAYPALSGKIETIVMDTQHGYARKNVYKEVVFQGDPEREVAIRNAADWLANHYDSLRHYQVRREGQRRPVLAYTYEPNYGAVHFFLNVFAANEVRRQLEANDGGSGREPWERFAAEWARVHWEQKGRELGNAVREVVRREQISGREILTFYALLRFGQEPEEGRERSRVESALFALQLKMEEWGVAPPSIQWEEYPPELRDKIIEVLGTYLPRKSEDGGSRRLLPELEKLHRTYLKLLPQP